MRRRCSTCGALMIEGSTTCPQCGQEKKQFISVSSTEGKAIAVESNRKFVSCESCGVGMKATALYCPKCGKSQSEMGTAPLPRLEMPLEKQGRWILIQVNGDEGTAVSLTDGFIIGRDKKGILGIEDRFVSERHLRLYEDSDGVWMQDIGSRNGTFIDDQLLDWKPIPLIDNLVVRLGSELTMQLTFISS